MHQQTDPLDCLLVVCWHQTLSEFLLNIFAVRNCSLLSAAMQYADIQVHECLDIVDLVSLIPVVPSSGIWWCQQLSPVMQTQ